jgi:methylmalonyl-CoA/ethylmalonyl-CoA epimerase
MESVESINHIGIAVFSIQEQLSFYQDVLGAIFEGTEEVPDQKVKVAFFRIGPIRLELLEPTDPGSPVARFLEKRGPGLHHIAYTVDDLPARLRYLKERGIQLIDEKPRPGAHQMSIAFLHPKSSYGVLTELCQPKDEHR